MKKTFSILSTILIALTLVLGFSTGIASAHTASYGTTNYYWYVECSTDQWPLFSTCTTAPVLAVNYNNTGGVYNALNMEVWGGSPGTGSCTWKLYDTKNGKLVWQATLGAGHNDFTILYNVYSTYQLHSGDCSGASGSGEDY